MDKNRRRAHRRHQQARMDRKRSRYQVVESAQKAGANPRQVARLLRTPKPCSCWMCGNPRRYSSAVPIQEQRADEALQTDFGAAPHAM